MTERCQQTHFSSVLMSFPQISPPLSSLLRLPMEKKDERIGFRIPADLKRKLLQIAQEGDRSLAQICEIFLRGAVMGYEREEMKFMQSVRYRRKASFR